MRFYLPDLPHETHAPLKSASLWHLASCLAGTVTLSGAIIAWPRTFLFGKVLSLPPLAAGFPWPTQFPAAWIFLCLVGPALTAPSFRRAALSVPTVLLLATVIGLLILPLPTYHPVANTAFNIVFIAGYHGGHALLVALALAGCKDLLQNPGRNDDRSTSSRAERPAQG